MRPSSRLRLSSRSLPQDALDVRVADEGGELAFLCLRGCSSFHRRWRFSSSEVGHSSRGIGGEERQLLVRLRKSKDLADAQCEAS